MPPATPKAPDPEQPAPKPVPAAPTALLVEPTPQPVEVPTAPPAPATVDARRQWLSCRDKECCTQGGAAVTAADIVRIATTLAVEP